MTDTVTSQNIDLSSWDTLCKALKLGTWFSYSRKCIDNHNNNFNAGGIIVDLQRLRVFLIKYVENIKMSSTVICKEG